MNTFFDSDEFDQCTEFELQTCYKYSNGVKSHRSKGDSEADGWLQKQALLKVNEF
jgi:hypothetical protein